MKIETWKIVTFKIRIFQIGTSTFETMHFNLFLSLPSLSIIQLFSLNVPINRTLKHKSLICDILLAEKRFENWSPCLYCMGQGKFYIDEKSFVEQEDFHTRTSTNTYLKNRVSFA